jgi:hypothetical protein
MILTLTDKLLSKEAATLYYSLTSTIKYVDLISYAVSCRLTPNEINKAIKELQELDLIETKTSIRKKKQKAQYDRN